MKKTPQSDIEALLASVPEEGGFDRLNHRKMTVSTTAAVEC